MTAKTDALTKLATAQSLIDDIVDDVTAIDDSGTGGSCETWLPTNDFDLDVAAVAFTAPSHWTNMKVYHDRMKPTINPGAVFFIGDSHFQGLSVSSVHPYSVNLGIGGDVMRGVINRTIGYTPLDSAGAVVLCIGINDFLYEGSNYIYNMPFMMDKILDHFEGGPVIWCLIPPIASANQTGVMTQANINTANGWIVSKAASYPNVTIVDVTADLKDGSGFLKSTHTIDGIHLNGTGYGVLIPAIKTALEGI